MTDAEKMDQLAEVFETTNLTADTQLDTLAWDSMAMLSVIALAKQNGKVVTGAQMREMKTVSDILAVL